MKIKTVISVTVTVFFRKCYGNLWNDKKSELPTIVFISRENSRIRNKNEIGIYSTKLKGSSIGMYTSVHSFHVTFIRFIQCKTDLYSLENRAVQRTRDHQ